MAAIDDLLNQITDATLRERIGAEIRKNEKTRKFGLVFEDHLPEYTLLNEFDVASGRLVIQKNEKSNILYKVQEIKDDIAVCKHRNSNEIFHFSIENLQVVAEFGDTIYPYLLPVDSVCNAQDSDLWHTLIEADNYHALQLLNYLYAKKVDCIYIDPPYNTGAKDWKYNNNYVDSSDVYKHSKWLSMMEKRLKLAKKLLKPDTGVLIVTIDEHEVHHLRTLLEQIFPEFYIQMTTVVINSHGVLQGRFSRVEEYNIFCFAQNAFIDKSNDNLLNIPDFQKKPIWKSLLRSGTDALRSDRPSMFYPILIDIIHSKVLRAGDSLPLPERPIIENKIDGYDVIWPIRTDGSDGRWSVGKDKLNELIDKGYVDCGKYNENKHSCMIKYISEPNQKAIVNGEIIIVDRNKDTNVVKIEYATNTNYVIKTVWHRTLHDAGVYGTTLLMNILGTYRPFSFPKSLYSTKDAVASVMRSRKDALILDFFAGSGTTLHAVNLLNAEDGGNRRCILVTNNEVPDKDSAEMLKNGLMPGSPQWESAGICRSVTWPRTVNSITGKRADGTVLSGEYFTTLSVEKSKSRNISQFPVLGNCTQNSQGSLIANNSGSFAFSVQQKKQIAAILGKIPQNAVTNESDYIVDEKYPAAILFNTDKSDEFLDALQENDHVSSIYIVTGDNSVFKQIKERIIAEIGGITVKEPLMLPMSAGFKANVAYFKLGFLDKLSVTLGRQFAALLPLLWLKAGSRGVCQEINTDTPLPAFCIFAENSFAVLLDEKEFNNFKEKLTQYSGIHVVYLVTDSEFSYRDMTDRLAGVRTIQLYRDYLDNFCINQG